MTDRDRLVASLVCVLVTTVTLAVSPRQGITRDEAYYMVAGERYVQYYQDSLSGRIAHPLAAGSIETYWSYNAEHPPLLKVLYGMSWRILHRCTCAEDSRWHPAVARLVSGRHWTLSLMSELTAFRLPTAVFFGLLCALVYVFFVEVFDSRRGALVAALLMFAQPRAFFHAQTASFDLPAATLCSPPRSCTGGRSARNRGARRSRRVCSSAFSSRRSSSRSSCPLPWRLIGPGWPGCVEGRAAAFRTSGLY